MAVTERQQQYLDAMGIQVWSKRQSSIPAAVSSSEISAVSTQQENVDVDKSEEGLIQAPIKQEQGKSVVDQWQCLAKEVAQCMDCRQLCQHRTQTVFGVGNQRAEWMIIGEAPGVDEDLQGEPFIGQAGKLLNEMLLAVGLKRQQVYITNIIKCRPPNNRDPQSDEVSNCRGFLQRQITLIKPRIILALGHVAAQSLLDSDTPVGTLRGKIHSYHLAPSGNESLPLVVSYHPAYLLQSPTHKQQAWQDLRLAKQVVENVAASGDLK